MNLLFSCIGKRGYIASYFRPHLTSGDRLVGTSNTKWTPGFCACDAAYIMPNLDSAEYHEAVLNLCDQESINGILTFLDPDIVRLAEIKPQLLDQGTIPIIPDLETAQVCFDKYETFKFLKANGFQTPESFVHIEEARQSVEKGDLTFPLIVKPRSGFGSRATFVARNDAELEVFFNYEPGMLIQEFIDGDAFDFDILGDLNGQPVSVVLWRKLRSTQGETEHVITCKDSTLLELGVRLGECLKHIGPMDVDLFVNDRGVFVLEMNPRFGGGYPVSQLAGADFPGLILKMLNGESLTSQIGNYQDDVVMIKTIDARGGPQEKFWTETMKIANLKQ